MNIQEGLNKLRDLLNKKAEQTQEVVSEKFETAKLNDGVTVIEYDGDLMIGTIVSVVDTKGQKLPLPKGQYQLEDGTSFEIVDDMGTADNVNKVGEEAAPVESAPETAPELAQAPQAPKAIVKTQVEEHRFDAEKEIETLRSSMEAKLAEVNEKFEAITEENEELRAELKKANELNKETFAIVNQIADEPSSEPTEQKQKFSVKDFRKEWKASIQEIEKKYQ